MEGRRSRFNFLLVLLLIFIFVPASHAYTRTVEGFVQKVSDGDTVTLITRDGAKLRVRLYGIDAPEVRHEKKTGQPFGEEAKRALVGKVLRKEVAITIQDKDQYKRMVGTSGLAIETSTRRWCGKGRPGRIENTSVARMPASSSTRREKQGRGNLGYGSSPTRSRHGSSGN